MDRGKKTFLKKKAFLLSVWTLLRPHQYAKNLFLFAPLFFAFKITIPSILLVSSGFLFFSLLSSAIYIFNDIMDLEYDKNHPTKKNRPLPSGEISLRTALYLSIGLILFSLLSFFFLPLKFCLILWGYGVLQILYSLWLKKIPIVDIMSIASGFLLRIWAGAILADVPLSHWIILLTFLLANFLALGKRREDLLLHQNGITTRENIHIYTEEFIQQGMQMMATISVVAYIMYTVSQDVIEKFGTDKLFLTSIFVILGFLRYFLVVSAERKIFDPTEILLKDRYLEGVLILWLLSFYFIRKFL